MRKHRFRFLLAFTAIAALAYLSCRKTIEIDDTDQGYPIALTFTQVGDSIKLEWAVKRTTNYIRTIVLQSGQPIPDGIGPQETGTQRIAFSTTDDAVDEVTVGIPVFENEAFFKLYIQLGSRFIESNTISINVNRFVGQGRPENTFFHPDSSWVVMAVVSNQGTVSYTTLDYRTNKILGEYNMGFISDFQTINCTFTRKSGKEYMLATNNSTCYKFEMPKMTIVETANISYTTWGILASTSNDFVFSTQYDYLAGFNIRNWNTLSSTVKAYERNNDYYYPRKLIFLDPQKLKFVEIGPYTINRLQASPTTGNLVTSYSKSVNGDGNFSFLSGIPQSPNRAYFIPNLLGNIYDTLLNVVKKVPLVNLGSPNDFAFSQDNKSVYAMETTFNPFGATVRKLNIETLEETARFFLPDVIPKRIHILPNGELLLLFIDVATQAKYSTKILNL
jgi:hypothetical protein